jgi:hypothetical protein
MQTCDFDSEHRDLILLRERCRRLEEKCKRLQEHLDRIMRNAAGLALKEGLYKDADLK